jgi:hypothetical protein
MPLKLVSRRFRARGFAQRLASGLQSDKGMHTHRRYALLATFPLLAVACAVAPEEKTTTTSSALVWGEGEEFACYDDDPSDTDLTESQLPLDPTDESPLSVDVSRVGVQGVPPSPPRASAPPTSPPPRAGGGSTSSGGTSPKPPSATPRPPITLPGGGKTCPPGTSPAPAPRACYGVLAPANSGVGDCKAMGQSVNVTYLCFNCKTPTATAEVICTGPGRASPPKKDPCKD